MKANSSKQDKVPPQKEKVDSSWWFSTSGEVENKEPYTLTKEERENLAHFLSL